MLCVLSNLITWAKLLEGTPRNEPFSGDRSRAAFPTEGVGAGSQPLGDSTMEVLIAQSPAPVSRDSIFGTSRF